jgi:hypothetical protein
VRALAQARDQALQVRAPVVGLRDQRRLARSACASRAGAAVAKT